MKFMAGRIELLALYAEVKRSYKGQDKMETQKILVTGFIGSNLVSELEMNSARMF